MISIFTGKEIDRDKINKLKNIAYKRYSSNIYKEYFNDINCIDDLANLHSINTEDENLAFGTDWFMCYYVTDYAVTILEWISLKNEFKVKQVVEMMTFLKQLFIQNKDKWFIADMRHDTSYLMYSKMLQKGFFKEIHHKCIIDCAAPKEVQNLKNKLIYRFNSLEKFLASDVSNDYSKYFKYILHHISFKVTDKFIERYNKKTTEAQVLRLKKK